MTPFELPDLSSRWSNFADWQDLLFALLGLALLTLLIIWWRQQTRQWFRVVTLGLLAALTMTIAGIYLYRIPPYLAGCPTLCEGWAGFPLPVARLALDERQFIAPLDFALNGLMLWILWLAAGLVWVLMGIVYGWTNRDWRTRLLFLIIVVVLPWALLPRVLNPPQLQVAGEDLRLANNARRSAEFTYRVTGVWIQRLGVEDVRRTDPEVSEGAAPRQVTAQTEVCLRGYTYFYLPWRRYRIELDESGTTALSLSEVPLRGSCWG